MSATIRDIQNATARAFGVSRDELVGRDRTAAMVAPRHVAMMLSRLYTRKSSPIIGREFGGRDHSTVLHGAARGRALYRASPQIRAKTAAVILSLFP